MPPRQNKPRAARPKRTARPKKPRVVAVQRDPDVPHWLPAGDRWNELPDNIRQAVQRILTPAYRRFVLDAPGELEQSIGLTLVHLMWLELCDQVQLALVAADPKSLEAILNNPEDMIHRHLRLATVKCETAELLMKLRVVSETLQRLPVAASPALAPPVHPSGCPGIVPSPTGRGNHTEPEIGNSTL